MKKTILFRLFGIGGIPGKFRPALDAEGIRVVDEGMSGRMISRNVRGPGKWSVQRSEGFSGSLVVTEKRILCFTYGKRQINLSTDDPKVSELCVNLPGENTLSISFESGLFREGWSGRIEYRFNTDKAFQFRDALLAVGARREADAENAGDVECARK